MIALKAISKTIIGFLFHKILIFTFKSKIIKITEFYQSMMELDYSSYLPHVLDSLFHFCQIYKSLEM